MNPQSALFGFSKEITSNEFLINQLLLIFKIYVYKNRDKGRMVFGALMNKFKSTRSLELKTQEIIQSDNYYYKKWETVIHLLI